MFPCHWRVLLGTTVSVSVVFLGSHDLQEVSSLEAVFEFLLLWLQILAGLCIPFVLPNKVQFWYRKLNNKNTQGMAAIVEEYKKIPLITRVYVTGCFLVTGACYLELLSPFQLYFSAPMIFKKYQVWRLFSNFFFFGSKFSLDYAFHLFFLTKYSSGLENGSFRDRTADFFYMLLFGSVCLMIIGPFFHLNFFGHSLSFMIVYIWSRRNAFTQLNFLGLFTFSAPYLP
eukprot:TRINITY_DN14820_c0_g1_i2.p1 TRINITY_DN14820_c0_g1~~TRINITY_DN14820_c0_g1_i2.p1  ORF type:complete len:228 (+),score=54.10 TRINITY_DN14820_c0_g1_i2:67-750(+)